TSTTPVSSNWTGPTKLRLVSEGGGPKYDRGTVVPMDAGAGNKLHPGPGPIGLPPGPWAELIVLNSCEAARSPAGCARGAARLTAACIETTWGEAERLTPPPSNRMPSAAIVSRPAGACARGV